MGAFRGRVMLRNVARKGGVVSREQVDIRQLWDTIHEDDVGGPHIPMRESAFVQYLKPACQPYGDSDALRRRQPLSMSAACQLVLKRLGFVNARIDLPVGLHVVRQLHHVAEVTFLVSLTHIENAEQIMRLSAQRLKILKPFQSSLVGRAAGWIIRRPEDTSVNKLAGHVIISRLIHPGSAE